MEWKEPDEADQRRIERCVDSLWLDQTSRETFSQSFSVLQIHKHFIGRREEGATICTGMHIHTLFEEMLVTIGRGLKRLRDEKGNREIVTIQSKSGRRHQVNKETR